MNIVKTLETAFSTKVRKNWDRIYIAIDIHDTIFKGCYSDDETYQWLGKARETLQLLSRQSDIVLIIYSSCHEEILLEYDHFFKKNGITINYYNSNPEVKNTVLASFNSKFYFNVLLDDKAGFEPETDWEIIYQYLCEKLE